MTIRPFEGNELLKLIDRLKGYFVGRAEIVWRAADVYSTAAQAIPAGAGFTSLTFNTVRKDTDSMWNAGTPTRLTCIVSGWYVISGQCSLAADPGGAGIGRYLRIAINGVSEAANSFFTPNALLGNTMAVARVIYLNSGDYVELQTQQGGAGAINTIAVNKSPNLALCRYP